MFLNQVCIHYRLLKISVNSWKGYFYIFDVSLAKNVSFQSWDIFQPLKRCLNEILQYKYTNGAVILKISEYSFWSNGITELMENILIAFRIFSFTKLRRIAVPSCCLWKQFIIWKRLSFIILYLLKIMELLHCWRSLFVTYP